MDKFKEKLALSFGFMEVCDFPAQPTAFEQYPSGRLIVGDRYDGEVLYYRLKVNHTTRMRGLRGVDFGALKDELYNVMSGYVRQHFGDGTRIHGWSNLYMLLNWQLNPNGRFMGQRPGTHIRPLGRDRGYQMYIEFANLIFLSMEPRVVCRDPKDQNGNAVTFFSRHYEEQKEFITPATVSHNYPRDGFFGRMLFEGMSYFFSVQVPELFRWNRIPRPEETVEGVPFEFEKRLSNSMDPETLSIAIHREISKNFTFMRPGTVGKPKDIQVLFPLHSRVREKMNEHQRGE